MVMSRRPDNPGQAKTRQYFVQMLSLQTNYPILNQRKEENDYRRYFMINIREKNWARFELTTPVSAI